MGIWNVKVRPSNLLYRHRICLHGWGYLVSTKKLHSELARKVQYVGLCCCHHPMKRAFDSAQTWERTTWILNLYQSLEGSLIFLTNTCPCITYAVSCVSRYMAAPQQPHLDATKRILRYAEGTTKLNEEMVGGRDNNLIRSRWMKWLTTSFNDRAPKSHRIVVTIISRFAFMHKSEIEFVGGCWIKHTLFMMIHIQ